MGEPVIAQQACASVQLATPAQLVSARYAPTIATAMASARHRVSLPTTCRIMPTTVSVAYIMLFRTVPTTASTAMVPKTGAMYDSAWDSKRASGCNCDAGFRGPDCSLKECPSGDDPLGGAGRSKGRPCSGRGTCNFETGTCTCYMGYYGNKWHMQTVLA